MANLYIFDPATGHTTVSWDLQAPEAEDAVGEARKIFDAALQNSRRMAFRVAGESSERITEFDPTAQEIYVIAPMVGG